MARVQSNEIGSLRRAWGRAICLVTAYLWVGLGGVGRCESGPVERPIRLRFEPMAVGSSGSEVLRMRGADARRQLLVTAEFGNGEWADYTDRVSYSVERDGVVRVDSSGRVLPLGDGRVRVQARADGGLEAGLEAEVEGFGAIAPVNFANQIVPIFTKAGCNAGVCHGKASGQNGFRLSLLGFEPEEDYDYLVKEARGRRLFPAVPERSLLLLKATGELPHGGGKRIEVGSDDYRRLVRWISQGMPFGKSGDPVVDRIEVVPKERLLRANGRQRLAVIAHYTDGSTEDVTQGALYEPNDKNMAKSDATGLIEVFDQPGDVAVMVRYQAKVAVFRATIPLGKRVVGLPAPRNFIDELVFKKLEKIGLPPSERCDDSTFMRRAALDIAGRLPTAEETRRFVGDTSPGKRDEWIEALLGSGEYADYFANKWAALLRNRRSAPNQTRGSYAFHDWIRDALLVNKPFNEFVREILAASGDVLHNPPVVWYRQVKEPTAQLEDTAQLFLGLRLQCAQCHHHPFEKWSQRDYFSFAAFFSQVGRKPGEQPGEEIIFAKRMGPSATLKKTKQSLAPAGLGGPVVEVRPDEDARQALVDWMTDGRNPFFARSLVNRYWRHFFGRGLVDPEDDMRETNPPTNPELLEALSGYFVASGFDLKELVRVICRSGVYQLSSNPNEWNAVDKQNFSRFYPKRLPAEVLYDAIHQVLEANPHFDGLPGGTRAVQLPDNSYNASSYFLTVFGRPEGLSACECERSQDASLAQSLHLLNSKELQEKLSSDKGRAARLAAEAGCSEEEKIRELYRSVYSREPCGEELSTALGYLEKKGRQEKPEAARRQAYEDIVWALINTKEFLFNH